MHVSILKNQQKIGKITKIHDSNIISLLHTLDAKENVLELESPDYASVVLVELCKNNNSEPYIKLYFIRNVTSSPKPITHFIGGFGGKKECLFEPFKIRSQRFFPNDIAKAYQKIK